MNVKKPHVQFCLSSLGVENGKSVVELKPKEVLTLGGHSLNSCTGNLHSHPQKGVGMGVGGGNSVYRHRLT